MAVTQYLAGKFAFITVGGTSYPMDSFSLDDTAEEVDVTNFTSLGFKQTIPGIGSATFSASGPYTGTAPTAGAAGLIVFGISAAVSATRNMTITSVKVSTQVKDKATLEITGVMTEKYPFA
jgi:hypothetical protein